MRILISQHGNKRLLKDRSLAGLPRIVVEEKGDNGRFATTKVYSKIWYTLDRVKEIEGIQ